MTVSPLKETTYMPDRSFPINVFRVGGIHQHWHDHIEWIYVKEGQAVVQVDGSFEQLEQGELTFVNTKQLHSAVALAPGTVLICIVFHEALVRGSGLDITEFHYFVPYLHGKHRWPSRMRANYPYRGEMNDAFSRLLEEFERKQPGYELLVKAELLRIFGLYFRFAEQSASQQLARIQKPHDFSRLLEMLRERYREPITVGEAAKRVSLSPNHFCKVFKQVTGKTFVDYIHTLRVHEAERLLLESNEPIASIAERVGFSTSTYFERVFKKARGITPSSARKTGKTSL